MTKLCRGCDTVRPFSDFTPRRDRGGRPASRCKSCMVKLCREWRLRHPGYMATKSAAWRLARNSLPTKLEEQSHG